MCHASLIGPCALCDIRRVVLGSIQFLKKSRILGLSRFSQLSAMGAAVLFFVALAILSPEAWAEGTGEVAYRKLPAFTIPLLNYKVEIPSRIAMWIAGQLHLYFAAFVLAVPIFAWIIELIGYKTGDKRYDKLAYDFTKLLSVSFSLTASLGAVLTFFLIILYPKFTNYFVYVFEPTFYIYVALFFAEAFFLYTYYYGWGKFGPKTHLALGLGLNIVGTLIMAIANAWVTFMTSPAGVDPDNAGKLISVWDAVTNYTWMPINIHRVIANVAFGGSVAAAYGAYKFLGAKTEEERAHYDWMGYMGNFIAIIAFLPLPFAGYWLGKEIYGFSQNLGMTLMGGAFSWLFIIQAVLIGNLFLSANFYLWLGMGRIPGAERFSGYIKYLLIAIMICFGIWATPNSIMATVEEVRKMGGSHHPILKFLGVMSAKNTAVNILILTTFLSFLLYRRGNKELVDDPKQKGNISQILITVMGVGFIGWMAHYAWSLMSWGFASAEDVTTVARLFSWGAALLLALFAARLIQSFVSCNSANNGTVSWARFGNPAQTTIFTAAVVYVIFIGIYGYFVPTKIRISMSVPQVLSVLATMILITVIDVLMSKNARLRGSISWGKMPAISQYCLFFTAITFTWLMGLMGYVRSGLRQHWHVYGIMQDTSPDAYTPTLGYAASVVSVTVVIFFLMVAFVFWLASLTEKKDHGGAHGGGH